jgi:hypothetical protein
MMRLGEQRWSRRESTTSSSSSNLLLVAAALVATTTIVVAISWKRKTNDRSSSCPAKNHNGPELVAEDSQRPLLSQRTEPQNELEERNAERPIIPVGTPTAFPELAARKPSTCCEVNDGDDDDDDNAHPPPPPIEKEWAAANNSSPTSTLTIFIEEIAPVDESGDNTRKTKDTHLTPLHVSSVMLPVQKDEPPSTTTAEELMILALFAADNDDDARRHNDGFGFGRSKSEKDDAKEYPTAMHHYNVLDTMMIQTDPEETDDESSLVSSLSMATAHWIHSPIRFGATASMRQRVKKLGQKLHRVSTRRLLSRQFVDNNDPPATGDGTVPPNVTQYFYCPESRC